MSDAARPHKERPRGTALLPSDLTEAELASAPVLASVDSLLVDGLSNAEDDAFAAAVQQ